MKRIYAFTLVTAAIGMGCALPAAATTINFDDLGNGAIVTTQYAGATFSSSFRHDVVTSAQASTYGTSVANIICSGIDATITCVDPVYVDFAAPVSGLSFYAVGDDSSGTVGLASVFAGATLLGSVNIVADGAPFDAPMFIDLSAFTGITRLEITTTDPAGLGYDDFTFKMGGVPEPASWAMMLAGFAAIGGAMRGRKVKTARLA